MQFLTKVLTSFTYATKGIIGMAQERNMKVHLAAASLVVIAGIFFEINIIEWYIVLILIAVIFALEMVNTAIEELANIVRDELKLDYKATQRARDVAAGAVFVMAIVSAIIGLTIFLPYVLHS